MSSSNIEDNDVFEITDFTTASDFERFIARLEEIIHEWKLTAPWQSCYDEPDFDIDKAQWIESTEEVTYVDYPFTVTHHRVKRMASSQSASNLPETDNGGDKKTPLSASLKELAHCSQDFPFAVHCLSRWYGLTNFLVINPFAYDIRNQSRIKILESAITVAIQNSGCNVPIFVQCLDKWRKYYMGCFHSTGIATNFDMVHLKNIPPKFRHLSGLLDIFKGKLNVAVEPLPTVQVTIRFTYILQDWEEYLFDWPQSPPDMDDGVESPAIGITQVQKLPFGACEDPISDLHLSTTWPNISEEVVTESDLYSDLDPLQAPKWTVRVNLLSTPQCLLGDSLNKFSDLCSRSETFQQVLGTMYNIDSDESSVDMGQALQRITETPASYSLPPALSKVSNVVSNTRLRLSTAAQQDTPIPVDVLDKLLLHFFPDAKETEENDDSKDTVDPKEAEVKTPFRCFKTAPVTSPVFKLAVCSCTVNYAFGGLKAVAHLWHEFVLEMRYRLENGILIPGIEKGSPNLAQGLIYQKLQMLNCCIEKKIQREEFEKETGEDNSDTKVRPVSAVSFQSNESGDDEFFECEDEAATEPAAKYTHIDSVKGKLDHTDSTKTIYEDSLQNQPHGRLRKFSEPCKLIGVDDDVYIPVTQEPAPMTEDMLAEHAEVLTRLGTSAEGANLRAKMQSASLLSDMESFKAANPGCILEDFVRWYSPRDLVIDMVIDKQTGDTVEKCSLSERMLVPGNMWQEVWQNAKPISARRQKRLFDDTKEAEKVLHFLSGLKPAQVVLHLLPMVCQAAVMRLREEGCGMVSTLDHLLDTLTNRLEITTRTATQSVKQYSDIIQQLSLAEVAIARARSLHLKFACDGLNKENDDVKAFTANLMTKPEVDVIGAARGPVGRTLCDQFREAKKFVEDSVDISEEDPNDVDSNSFFPKPTAREYILRTTAPRPAPYSKSLPQRMYCTLIDGSEYRLAGALSSDTTFQ